LQSGFNLLLTKSRLSGFLFIGQQQLFDSKSEAYLLSIIPWGHVSKMPFTLSAH